MRRLVPVFSTLLVVGAFLYTLFFLYEKSQQPDVLFETANPSMADIVQRTVASGSIVPRREVAIKPRVSGILQELAVEPGATVAAGDIIATIKIVPNVVNLSAAESRFGAAKIRLANQRAEYERLSALVQQQLISHTELNRAKLEAELAKQEVKAAGDNLQLIKEGAIRGSGKVSNVVRATVAGMVIEVPVKEGVSVTETNNFNEGTTLATIADMSDLVFEGFVDESEIGKLREGMPTTITIGALSSQTFDGRLEHIAPKGTDNEGTIEFQVRAALRLSEGAFVRANYSANASIVLDTRTEVLAVPERLLQFEGERAFVEVETASAQQFEKRYLELGLSDGVTIEVKGGVTEGDTIKVPQGVRGS